MVKNDYKIFEFSGKKVLIDQLETVEQAKIINEKKRLFVSAMAKVKDALKVDFIFVVISDILEINSKILLLSETEQKTRRISL
jgi:inorganic pyrophosphatase/exopolyphosphatase